MGLKRKVVVGADLCVGPSHAFLSGVTESLRLPAYNYSTPGAYFITAIVHKRAPLFGDIADGDCAIHLSDAGRMIDHWWSQLPQKFPSVDLDAHALMPDHLHGVLFINCKEAAHQCSLSGVVQWFKTMTTAEYFRGVRNGRWPCVQGRLWQRGFYDHIVRSEHELERIRQYVEGNPGRLWELTHPNPMDGRADT